MIYALKRYRLILLTSVGALSGGTASAADYLVPSGTTSTAQITAGGTDTVTLDRGGTLSVNDTAIRWNGTSTDLRITNDGTIESVATGGRAINAGGNATSPRILTLINNAGGVITSQSDAIRINTDITSGGVTLVNAGTIISTVDGQSLDFDAVSSTAPGAISITNQATGIIQSTDADGIRPGEGAIVHNFGFISAGDATNTSSDGVDLQGHSGTIVNEASGTITGGRHGITTDVDVHVTNYGTIVGRNGSGVGSDGKGTVINYGRITGAYNGSGTGDGDGLDFDYYGIVYNNGTIEGLGAAGGPVDYPRSSEGIALTGGGIIENDTDGVITGVDVGISAYDVFAPGAVSQITNRGRIYGGNHGIGGNGEVSIVNYGTIGGGINGLSVLSSGTGSWTIDNFGSIEGAYGSMTIQSGATAVLRMESGSRVSGAIFLGGTIDIDTVADYTFSDMITGEGRLIKSGAAVLSLTGANEYSGGTTVSGGTLRGSTDSLQGPIVNNATLEFAQTASGTYGSEITGTGSLVKSGSGALRLTGVSTIGGTATVSAGTLAIDGTLSTGGMTVTRGGTLGGSGIIVGAVSIASGGTLSPGNSPGTLTVHGNLTLASGAGTVLEVDGATWAAAGGAGSYDRLVVNGTFAAAGTLTANFRGISGPATNSYTPVLGTRYTVVTANAVTGTFDTVAQGAGNLAIRLDPLYSNNTVQLVVTPTSFASLGLANGWNANALAAASALDATRSSSGTAALLGNLYGMDGAGYGLSFSQMSGEIYADALQGVVSAARTNLRVVRDQALHVEADGLDGSTVQVWTRYIQTRENPDKSAIANGYSANTDGFVAGVTLISEPGLRLGVAGGYSESKVKNGLGEAANGSSEVGYVYAAYTPNPRLDVTAAGGFAHAVLDASRTVDAETGTVSASGKARSFTLQFAVDARFQAARIGGLSLYGVAGVEAGLSRSSRISESASNSVFALTLPRDQWNTIDGRLGGEVVQRFKGVNVSAYGTWLVQMGASPTASRDVELAGARWKVRSTGLAKSGVAYGASVSAQIMRRLSIQGSYEGDDRGRGYHNDRFSAGLGLTF